MCQISLLTCPAPTLHPSCTPAIGYANVHLQIGLAASPACGNMAMQWNCRNLLPTLLILLFFSEQFAQFINACICNSTAQPKSIITIKKVCDQLGGKDFKRLTFSYEEINMKNTNIPKEKNRQRVQLVIHQNQNKTNGQ